MKPGFASRVNAIFLKPVYRWNYYETIDNPAVDASATDCTAKGKKIPKQFELLTVAACEGLIADRTPRRS